MQGVFAWMDPMLYALCPVAVAETVVFGSCLLSMEQVRKFAGVRLDLGPRNTDCGHCATRKLRLR
jgi:hypothetical protein